MKKKLQRLIVPEPANPHHVEADREKVRWVNSPVLSCQLKRGNPSGVVFTCDNRLVISMLLATCGIVLLSHGIPLLSLSSDQQRRSQ